MASDYNGQLVESTASIVMLLIEKGLLWDQIPGKIAEIKRALEN